MNPLQTFAASIRILSMDAVQKANSGHPGAPMGMADMAAVLWLKHLRVNPADTQWHNRDRFVLSNGHASMLQYAALHLTGYDLSLDDLKNFRQLHSKTPGHPEYHDTPGVELTTGPLGQGIATAVGFAIAERHMAARYNRERLPLVDHYTYVFAGDGCLMEGVSSEACSLAGTLGLGKLICLYDSNGISIDGEIAPWFGEDTALRYEAYGWQVIRDVDGHDHAALDAAISAAKAETGKPTLIICRTKIGYGSPNLQGTEKTHGAPLGKEEIALTKQALGLPAGDFELPPDAYQIASLREKGAKLQDEWERIWQEYQDKYPMEAQEYARVMSGKLPDGLDRVIESTLAQYNEAGGAIAPRKASENAINLLAPLMPELIGGSADLTGSNLTWSKAASKSILPGDFSGNYLHYGVREFAMATIMNGLALYGGLRAYGGTFLVFSDYMRNGIRLSALMKLPVTYVLTHDSLGLGEDGSTHQPIEPRRPSLRSADKTCPNKNAVRRRAKPSPKAATSSKRPKNPTSSSSPPAPKSRLPPLLPPNCVKKACASRSSPCPAWTSTNNKTRTTAAKYCPKACRPSSSKRALPCRGAASAVTAAPSSASTPSANPPRLPNSSRCSVSPSKTSSPKARRCSKP